MVACAGIDPGRFPTLVAAMAEAAVLFNDDEAQFELSLIHI